MTTHNSSPPPAYKAFSQARALLRPVLDADIPRPPSNWPKPLRPTHAALRVNHRRPEVRQVPFTVRLTAPTGAEFYLRVQIDLIGSEVQDVHFLGEGWNAIVRRCGFEDCNTKIAEFWACGEAVLQARAAGKI